MPGVAGLMNGCTGFIYLSQGLANSGRDLLP